MCSPSFYPRLCLEKIFPALKVTQNCYINGFLLEIWQFSHMLVPPLLHAYRAAPERLSAQSEKI